MLTKKWARLGGFAGLGLLAFQLEAQAQHTVYLNFGETWKTELDFATNLIGVEPFSNSQKEQLKGRIFEEINRIYEDYDVSFHLNDPGGVRHVIDFSLVFPSEESPGNGLGVYGSTPVNALGAYDSAATARINMRNWGLVMQNYTLANRVVNMGIDVGQVAAHELGHIFGLNHQHAYANPGITPANYLNTGNLQLGHIMGTPAAPWGVHNSFNPFERAMLDISGGTFMGGMSLVNNPVMEANESGDAGATPATAVPIRFSPGETSGLQLSLRRGDVDGTESDVDVYSFTITSPGALSVNVISGENFYDAGQDVDTRLRLIAPDGTTVLADYDDLYYLGNVFNHQTYIDYDGSTQNVTPRGDDPFLVNFPLTELGKYYLEVSAVDRSAIGDGYQMIASFDGTVALPQILGDIDYDGDIDLSDLSTLAAHYGTVSGATWDNGDFDGDGDVDLSDLSILAAYYGTGEAQAMADFRELSSVPEPATAAGVLLLGLMGMRVRRSAGR